MSKASDIARRLAADFAELASELEVEHTDIRTKLSRVMNKAETNEQTLRDVANLILERLK